MTYSLIQVTLPVFIILASGYSAVKFAVLTITEITGVLKFSQNVAIPIFLFLSMLELDFSGIFNWHILFSYYSAAVMCFSLGSIIAHKYLNCSSEECIAIGFCILFSNTILLGLPITTLAYGDETLASSLAIISTNAPFCYLLGITLMEFNNNTRSNYLQSVQNIILTTLSNNITLGLILGLLFNFLGVQIFSSIHKSLNLLSIGAVSIALFSLGGVIVNYRLSNNIKKIILIIVFALFLNPILIMVIGHFLLNSSLESLKSALIIGSMGPGINAFIFASIYKKEMETAAGAVLVCTPLSIFSSLLWISVI